MSGTDDAFAFFLFACNNMSNGDHACVSCRRGPWGHASAWLVSLKRKRTYTCEETLQKQLQHLTGSLGFLTVRAMQNHVQNLTSRGCLTLDSGLQPTQVAASSGRRVSVRWHASCDKVTTDEAAVAAGDSATKAACMRPVNVAAIDHTSLNAHSLQQQGLVRPGVQAAQRASEVDAPVAGSKCPGCLGDAKAGKAEHCSTHKGRVQEHDAASACMQQEPGAFEVQQEPHLPAVRADVGKPLVLGIQYIQQNASHNTCIKVRLLQVYHSMQCMK
jgi:hypothetical protein